MSVDRQNLSSSTMEMDDIDEIAHTLVSEGIRKAVLDLSKLIELMRHREADDCAKTEQADSSADPHTTQKLQEYLENFFTIRQISGDHRQDEENEEGTYCCTSPAMSERSIMTCSSWLSNTDSDITNIMTPDIQNVNEEIKKICQHFVDELTMEQKEEDEDRNKVMIAETESTSRLSTRSEKSKRPASFSSDTTAMIEAAKEVVTQVTDYAVRVVQTPEVVRTLQSNKSDKKAKKAAGKSLYKKLLSAGKISFLGKGSKVKHISHVEKPYSKVHLSSTPQEDTTEKEIGNLILFPSHSQDEVPQLLGETSEHFQEEVRKSQNSDDEVLRADVRTDGEVSPLQTHTKSPLCPDILEEERKEDEEVFIPETLQTSRLATRSEDGEKSYSPASPSCTSSVENTPGSQVTEQAVRTMESTDSKCKAKRPVRKTTFGNMRKAWKKRFGKKQCKKYTSVLPCKENESVKERSVSLKSNLISTSLKGQKKQDEAEYQWSIGLHQVFTQPLDITATEVNEDQVMEIYLPPGPHEKDEQTIISDKASKAGGDLTPVLKRFLQNLTEKQWREVSEGVYNRDVKKQLIDMCLEMLRVIANSVTKKILLSIHQSSATLDNLELMSPMSSENLTQIFNCNITSCVESSFSQAVCDILGADIPIRISPEFTEAMAAEVLDEVRTTLSVTLRSSVDEGPSSTTAPASYQVSKERSAEKILAGVISTLKSFLTGRATVVKRKIVTQVDLESITKEETPTRGHSTKRKLSLWGSNQIQPVSQKDLNIEVMEDDDRSPHSIISKAEEEKTRNSFCSFFSNTCSSFSKKKEKKKKKKACTKQSFPQKCFCFSGPCSCCFENKLDTDLHPSHPSFLL